MVTMNFDLGLVPFSRHGSYIAFSHLAESGKRQEGMKHSKGPQAEEA